MDEIVENIKLFNFIPISLNGNIDFAKITYECGAYDFVDMETGYEVGTDKITRSYSFQEFYVKESPYSDYNYFVLYILGKSYVMYEIEEDNISIWVCYTEEEEREKGYITLLLSKLTELFPNKNIVGDTFNEDLIKILRSLNIPVK